MTAFVEKRALTCSSSLCSSKPAYQREESWPGPSLGSLWVENVTLLGRSFHMIDDFINQFILLSFLGRHEPITIGIFLDRG